VATTGGRGFLQFGAEPEEGLHGLAEGRQPHAAGLSQ
jgi:hypothetical protein